MLIHSRPISILLHHGATGAVWGEAMITPGWQAVLFVPGHMEDGVIVTPRNAPDQLALR